MKIASCYLVKAVSQPGQAHAAQAAHFAHKAGFEIDLDEGTGWVTIAKQGQKRLIPPHNVSCLIPLGDPPPAKAAANKAPKPRPGVET